jgi:hypothetical protein
MINHYVKYEDFVINSFQDNQRNPCGLPTDRWTDEPTQDNFVKNYLTMAKFKLELLIPTRAPLGGALYARK